MLSIDEAIARERELTEIYRNDIVPKEDYHNMPWIDMENELNMRRAKEHEQLAEWLEELKAIKKIDLSIPQHFTKEQSDWIKEYCINRNKEFYNKAIDDFIHECDKHCGFYSGKNKSITREDILKIAEQLKE